MFCYLGKFGQADLWPSLPNQATKKKENCCRLYYFHISANFHSFCSHTGTLHRRNDIHLAQMGDIK